MDDYFSTTLQKCTIDFDNICKYIVTPIMGYHICNKFIGDYNSETNTWKPTAMGISKPEGYDILKYGFNGIEYLDILYVQINYFKYFYKKILPKINKPFILITGQWQLPQLCINKLTDNILKNKYVYWFSQNPIYDHPRYHAIPYGICHYHLSVYVKYLFKKSILKKNKLINLHINKGTHPGRNIIPDVDCVPLEEYYEKVTDAQFILSPIGDRPDCYRHWEAIGLETIPISNAPDLLKNLFKDNMVYVNNTEEMLLLINSNGAELKYWKPNRNIICVDYWKNVIQKYVEYFRWTEPPPV